MKEATEAVRLKDETLDAFREYIHTAETGMQAAVLWSDASEERASEVRAGSTVARLWSGERPVRVPEGLIHDWIGATYIPAATVDATLRIVQDYDNHKRVYTPEVIESELMSRSGNDYHIRLRLLKKKVRTVVLDTEHQVHYFCLDPSRWCCHSYSTRISEVESAGTKKERVHAPDTGHGFLWRFNSYWTFVERDAGVYVECRAVSLTRDVPKALAWIIEPIVKKLPRESLISTLNATRNALSPRPDPPPANAPDVPRSSVELGPDHRVV